ncbi:MAG: CHAD domain-containing protein, partial [Candidatus Poribacteria bacterium]|nr:CHAD domain-containing protein [Candidatus Poribacteria bacterium]
MKPQKSYRRNASIILSAKIAEVYSWDNYIGDPENIEELHNMRISIKRLRYSMEIFSVNYDQKFNESLQIWVGLQKLLGSIHDCDVGQDVLTDYLKADPQEGGADTLGVNALIQRYRQTREERYQEFLKLWSSLQKEGMKMMDVFLSMIAVL